MSANRMISIFISSLYIYVKYTMNYVGKHVGVVSNLQMLREGHWFHSVTILKRNNLCGCYLASKQRYNCVAVTSFPGLLHLAQ